jgi:hypothetical protein
MVDSEEVDRVTCRCRAIHKLGGDLLVFRAKQSGNALAFFRDVMDSEVVPSQLRLVAAQGLAPYEHPRCSYAEFLDDIMGVWLSPRGCCARTASSRLS